MAFGNRIELYEAEHGLPRRADEAYLPPLHAFYRCLKDGGQKIVSPYGVSDGARML